MLVSRQHTRHSGLTQCALSRGRTAAVQSQSRAKSAPSLIWRSGTHATMPHLRRQRRPSLRNGHCWPLLCTQASGHCRPDTAPFIQASASLRLGKGHADDDARREGGGGHDEGARGRHHGRRLGARGVARAPGCSQAGASVTLDWRLSALFGIQAAAAGGFARDQKQPRASGWAVGDRMGRGAQEVDHAATPARGAPARAVVALAGWPTRAPGAGLGGAGPTRAAALAGRAATVAVLASARRTTGARHLGRLVSVAVPCAGSCGLAQGR